MPIYEYYCPDNHTIYQFYAKTLAQGQTTPKCPDNPRFRLKKVVSAFAITSGGAPADENAEAKRLESTAEAAEDARLDREMEKVDQEFADADEHDPRAMGRMMRRMSEIAGGKMDGRLEEVVRKLEEGTDPDALEDRMGIDPDAPEDSGDPFGGGLGGNPGDAAGKPQDPKEPRHRFKARSIAPRRDPKLYDYD